MKTDKAVETWYSGPGVLSQRESVDPDTPQPSEKPEETKKPTSSSSSGSVTNYVSVSFALGNGQADISLPTTQTVAKGTAISSLPTPSKAGVIFLGWYYDSGLTQRAAGSDTIESNMTLYAKTAAGEKVQSVETPNYIMKTDVTAGTYTFTVTGATNKSDIKFINVTGAILRLILR